jgi:hypothetical protein
LAKGIKKRKQTEARPKIDNNVVTVTTLPTTNKKTEPKITEQSNVSPKTVRNAEKFADAVDKVAENTGINYIGYYQVKERRNNSESQTCI